MSQSVTFHQNMENIQLKHVLSCRGGGMGGGIKGTFVMGQRQRVGTWHKKLCWQLRENGVGLFIKMMGPLHGSGSISARERSERYHYHFNAT